MSGTLLLFASDFQLFSDLPHPAAPERRFETRNSKLETPALSSMTLVAGLPLFLRTLYTARQIGIQRYILVADREAQDAMRRHLRSARESAGLPSKILWVDLGRFSEGNPAVLRSICESISGPVWMAQPRALFDRKALEEIKNASVGAPWAILATEKEAPPLAHFPQSFFRMERLELALKNGIPSDSIQPVTLRDGICLSVEIFDEIKRVERRLLRNTGNALDGYVDRYLNRRLSEPLTLFFLKTPLSPNGITSLTLLVGMIAAALFLPGGYLSGLAGALLYQFSSVLDCCDGAVARLKFRESSFGRWLDDICDTLVFLALFLAIGWAYGTDGGVGWKPLAGSLALGTTGSFLVVSYISSAKGNRTRSMEKVRQRVETIAPRDFSAILLFFALMGKLRWLILGVAVSANLFWIFFLGMIVWSMSRE
jgi:phosphatidylglycerophosphate synthase